MNLTVYFVVIDDGYEERLRKRKGKVIAFDNYDSASRSAKQVEVKYGVKAYVIESTVLI